MKNKSLKSVNTHLQNTHTARKKRIRSIASSTAIETKEPISVIEEKLAQPNKNSSYQVELA